MSTRTAKRIGFVALAAALGTLTATNADPMTVMVSAAVVLVFVLISAGKPHTCGRTHSETAGRQIES